MDIEKKFGRCIVNLRKERGYSQEYIAAKAGISRHYLSDIENGRRHLSLSIAERIASVLGITVTQIMQEIDH